MMVFAIYDEPKALRVLCRCVEEAAPGTELRAFDKAADALDAMLRRQPMSDRIRSPESSMRERPIGGALLQSPLQASIA